MTTDNVLLLMIQAVFLFLTGLTLLARARQRTVYHLEAVLVIATVSCLVLVITDRGRVFPEWFLTACAIAAALEPYLLLRLLQHIRPMPRWMLWCAVSGCALAWLILLLFAAPRPVWTSVVGAFYFAGLNGYAGVQMARTARLARGITPWRAWLIAVSLILFASIVLVAGMYVGLELARYDGGLLPLGAGLLLLMAFALFLGLVPPRWMQQWWLHSELVAFLNMLTAKPDGERATAALTQVTKTAVRGVGAQNAFVMVFENASQSFVLDASLANDFSLDVLPLQNGIVERVWQTQSTALARTPDEMGADMARLARSFHANALAVIPILPLRMPGHLLLVWLADVPLFVEDECAFLTLLGDETAKTLDRATFSTEHERQEEKFRRLLESAPDAMVIADQNGQIVLVNAQTELLFGFARTELIGQPIEMLMPGDAHLIHQRHRVAYVKNPRPRPMHSGKELRARRKDGSEFPSEISLSPIKMSEGLLVAAAIRDITDRKQIEQQIRQQNIELELRVQERTADLRATTLTLREQILERERAEQALRESEAHFRALLENSFDAVSLFDRQGNLLYTTPSTAQVVGYVEGEYVGRNIFELAHPDDIPLTQDALRAVLAAPGQLVTAEFRLKHKNGAWIWVEGVGSNLLDEPSVRAIVVNYRDVTERKITQQALEHANTKLSQQVIELQEINQDITMLNTLGGAIQSCENKSEVLRAMVYYMPMLFANTRGAIGLRESAQSAIEGVTEWGGQVYFCIPLTMQNENMGVLHLAANAPEHLSERKQQLALNVAAQLELTLSNLLLRESLREQSIRDPLTNLYNRRYLQQALEREIQRAARAHSHVGLIMLDLDHFKAFNDSFGHDAGDSVLCRLALALLAEVRQEDIVCRYGGEEFALIMPSTSPETLQARAEELRRTLKHIEIFHQGVLLPKITVSLGLACYPQHGLTDKDLLRAADGALYRAKERGRDKVVAAGET